MIKFQFRTVVFFLLCFSYAKAQTDTSYLLKYPYVIGNIAFAVDSLETPLGNIPQGGDTTITIGLYNKGNKNIKLISAKSNRFVEIIYEKTSIAPATSTKARVIIKVPGDMPPGDNRFEAVFETGDDINPYKFLYFTSQIIKKSLFAANETLDTVPRLIFDNYLYDFGHLRKGKTLYHSFYFTNRGAMDLFIREIVVDKGLVITELPSKIIKPGGSGHITVKIKARRYVGVLHKGIKIVSNDPVNPVLTLGIHGTIKQIPSKQNPTDYCID